LRQGGFEVVEFEDGQDALNKLQRATVDLIITDLPALADMDPAQCYLSWAVELASPCAEAELREVFEFVEHLAEIRITRAKVPQLPVNALSTLLVATAVEALVPEPEQEHVNAPARRKTAAKKPDASGAALLQS
jgi:two-component system chemotaxis sensor kinase CheA